METHEGGLLRSEQHAHVITGDTTMLTSQEKSFGKVTTRLGLATTVAALWIAAVPFASAAAAGTGYHISAARAAAIHECSVLADQYSEHDWGNTEIYQYRGCMAGHGQQE
jgi:hypothetical protein